ncbi:hypothetical protein IV203_025136 [Nitzschia inconspicua]|uniref:Uncharacterized protein n=1 Tax=Nitzschia inconspicua TaxID=303405 RepID=A0A9K3Q093_9STRA|nr:hypothetical protein IV203_025136 [Nitzschia inconspicua]
MGSQAQRKLFVWTLLFRPISDEQRRAFSGLPSYPSQKSNQDISTTRRPSFLSSSINDSGWETGGCFSRDDDVASSVWTSDLRLGDGDDCNIEQNISGHSDIQTVKLELAQAEREQFNESDNHKDELSSNVPPLGKR